MGRKIERFSADKEGGVTHCVVVTIATRQRKRGGAGGSGRDDGQTGRPVKSGERGEGKGEESEKGKEEQDQRASFCCRAFVSSFCPFR